MTLLGDVPPPIHSKADYHRYLFELTSNAQSRLGLASLSQRQHQMKKRRRSSAALAAEPHLDRAFQAYRHAAEHAFDTLEPTTGEQRRGRAVAALCHAQG